MSTETTTVEHEDTPSTAQEPIAYHGQTPPNVQILKEKPEHRVMMHLKAQGFSNREIAKELGYQDAWVSQITRQPWFIEGLAKIQDSIGLNAAKKVFDRYAVHAAETVVDLMDNAKSETVRASCAFDIINRNLGKAPQVVNIDQKTLVQYEDITHIDKELNSVNEQIRRITGTGASTTEVAAVTLTETKTGSSTEKSISFLRPTS